MRICFISTYPPRMCGLATFTKDLQTGMRLHSDREKEDSYCVAALQDDISQVTYGPEVIFTIAQDRFSDYYQAAHKINAARPDLCILSHEFGIFGGKSGCYILPLIAELEIPLITIFHTLLTDPDYHQAHIMQEILDRSAAVVVMNSSAVQMLNDHYRVDPECLHVIPHGSPDVDFRSLRERSRRSLRVSGKTVLFTFGLMSPGKGIETVLRAIPAVVERHPEVLYVVQGKTHPKIEHTQGEVYRKGLRNLAKRLGISSHVRFVDSYLSNDELNEYLAACDIYILPYPNTRQITSGTLSFALGAGCAVISTPNYHARSVITDGLGRLFEPGDHEGLSEILARMLSDPSKLQYMRDDALEFADTTRWSVVGETYRQLAEGLRAIPWEPFERKFSRDLLQLDLRHLVNMTSEYGMYQHAVYHLPDYRFGYAADDNARALELATCLLDSDMLDEQQVRTTRILFRRYLTYMTGQQKEGGDFHNFTDARLSVCNERIQSEDTYGRVMRALCTVMASGQPKLDRELAALLYSRALPIAERLEEPRGLAQMILALITLISSSMDRSGEIELLCDLVRKSVHQYATHQQVLPGAVSWRWVSDKLTYENAVIPEALIRFGSLANSSGYVQFGAHTSLVEEAVQAGFEMLQFLDGVVHRDHILSPVGNRGWYRRGEKCPIFDQQPLNVHALLSCYVAAFQYTGDAFYRERAEECFLWYHGRNVLHLPLGDPMTGGCFDGLELDGVNMNMGAESTIVYLTDIHIMRTCFPDPGSAESR